MAYIMLFPVKQTLKRLEVGAPEARIRRAEPQKSKAGGRRRKTGLPEKFISDRINRNYRIILKESYPLIAYHSLKPCTVYLTPN